MKILRTSDLVVGKQHVKKDNNFVCGSFFLFFFFFFFLRKTWYAVELEVLKNYFTFTLLILIGYKQNLHEHMHVHLNIY